MLTKLLKYEFKATARLFLPLYAVLLVFALLNRFINPFQATINSTLTAIIASLSMAAYFALIVGVFVMTLIIMIQRFYKSLLGDEGYLMFTLPVHTWQLIVSKLVVAMTWSILSYLVAIGSVLILSRASGAWIEIWEVVTAFRGSWIYLISGFIFLASGTMMIYAAIALGHLFSRHKLLAAFGMYCGLYLVFQLVTTIVFLLATIVFLPSWGDPGEISAQLNLIFLPLTFSGLFMGTGYFVLTNYILRRKLNLE